MKRLLVVASLAFYLAGPAFADTVDALLKNTLTLTNAQGGVTTVLLSDANRFQQTNAKGMRADGFWTHEDDKLCMTARGEARICMPLEADKDVGDTWDVKGPTGQVVWTAAIVQGRADVTK